MAARGHRGDSFQLKGPFGDTLQRHSPRTLLYDTLLYDTLVGHYREALL